VTDVPEPVTACAGRYSNLTNDTRQEVAFGVSLDAFPDGDPSIHQVGGREPRTARLFVGGHPSRSVRSFHAPRGHLSQHD
jgi:hypothetical protein